MSRRVLAALVGAALLAAACTGDGGGGAQASGAAAPGEPGRPGADVPARSAADLVIWSGPAHAAAIEAVAQGFGSERGVTADVQVVRGDLRAAVISADAAGAGPDAVAGPHNWIGDLAAGGTIAPLRLPADTLAGYADLTVDATTYDGALYALPYGFEALALFRNTAAVPAAPRTLDEAVSAGQSAVDAGVVESALSLRQGPQGDAYFMQPLLTSMGGYLFGTTASGGYDPGDLGIGGPGSIAAARRIHELGEQGSGVLRRSIGEDTADDLFAQGKAAFLISGPWVLKPVRAGGIRYAISTIPPFAGQQPARSLAVVQSLYVTTSGRHRRLAEEFVATVASDRRVMRTLYDGTALTPAMTAVAEAVGSTDADVRAFAQAGRSAEPMPSIPAMNQVWGPLGEAYAAIIGGADPERTMRQAGITIAAAID